MASERDPAGSEAGVAGKREGFPVRLVLLGLLALYLILFVVLNAKSVTVSFVLFSTRVSLIVALVLASVLGFLAGYLGRELRGRRGRS
ncbi:MAG TPA: hypothetical protein VFB26_10445 [Gaiellaceae bacterium]|nr:hypothetical protein [Gaiellaceae bacterium]